MTTNQSVLEVLANMEYPGRFMVLGQGYDLYRSVVIYGITGRSTSSQARVLVQNPDGSISTKPTDEEQLKKGNPALLIYNAITTFLDQEGERLFVVSNGAQTDLIHATAREQLAKKGEFNPLSLLVETFKKPHYVQPTKPGEAPIDLTSFEPDDPNYTPRISGVLHESKGAFALVRRCMDSVTRQFFEFSLDDHRGFFLATYTGRNVPKGEVIPSFVGEPLPVSISALGNNASTITDQVYAALGPKQGEGIVSPGLDMRVGVATLLYDHRTGVVDVSIKNRQETKQ